MHTLNRLYINKLCVLAFLMLPIALVTGPFLSEIIIFIISFFFIINCIKEKNFSYFNNILFKIFFFFLYYFKHKFTTWRRCNLFVSNIYILYKIYCVCFSSLLVIK